MKQLIQQYLERRIEPCIEHLVAIALVLLAITGAVLLAVTLGDRD